MKSNDQSLHQTQCGSVTGLALPWVIGFGLLFKKATRPWGVGILIGVAVTEIVCGGLCVAIIQGLNNSE